MTTHNLRSRFSALEKYEFLIPLILFVLFLAITLPGISWGVPSTWHPDEIVVRSLKALHGEWQFDEINFDYPSLPQYVMYWLGRVMLSLGKTDIDVWVASRVLSAILAGLTIVLTYFIARKITNNVRLAGLSGLLLFSVSEMTHNGRFAHNDTYVTFFTCLFLFFLVHYTKSNRKGWLYAAFVAVGMAASSKYNGIGLVIVPVLMYLFSLRRSIFKHMLEIGETLFIGSVLTFLGFAAGTPKSLFWMSFYFKRMIPALIRTGNYARQPGSVRGILGQYSNFIDGVGWPLFLLFLAAFLWICYWMVKAFRAKQVDEHDSLRPYISLFLLTLLAVDLPIMLSYNYPIRFFLPMMSVFSIFASFFVMEIYGFARGKANPFYPKVVGAVLTVIIAFSIARDFSVMMLFLNDARIPASEFVATLPAGTSLEYTYYPPTIPGHYFGREHNYPIHFVKIAGEPLPVSKKFVFNAGEAGLDDRLTDYLVIDTFTSNKLHDPYTCANMQVECDFFKQLEAGLSDHYRLLAKFTYALPPYLPQINVAFVNPGIFVYERIK